MSQRLLFKELFKEIPFSQKSKMSYFQWCGALASLTVSGKIFTELKVDYDYLKGYITIGSILTYIGIVLLWLSNIVLFPIYAIFLKLYWSRNLKSIMNKGEDPLFDMMVNTPEFPELNGLKIIKILSTQDFGSYRSYSLMLSNNEIVSLNDNQILSKNVLLIERDKLLKELAKIEHKLEYFNSIPLIEQKEEA